MCLIVIVIVIMENKELLNYKKKKHIRVHRASVSALPRWKKHLGSEKFHFQSSLRLFCEEKDAITDGLHR